MGKNKLRPVKSLISPPPQSPIPPFSTLRKSRSPQNPPENPDPPPPYYPPSNPSPPQNHSFVGKTFYLVIFPMKWSGIFHVTIRHSGAHYGPPNFFTKVYTAISSFLVSTCVVLYTLNRGFDIGWPFRLWAPLKPQDVFDDLPSGERPPPKFFIWVTLSLQILIPMSSVFYGHLGLLHLSDYCTFLNRWSTFSKSFHLYFSPYSNSLEWQDLKWYRNWYIRAFCLVLGSGLIFVPFMSRTNVFQIEQNGTLSRTYVNTFITIFWVESLVGIRVISSVKDFLNLKILAIAYRELRKGIETQYLVLNEKVNRLHVRNWLKMVVFIREQRTLLENHMGFQHNWMMAEIFAVTLLVLTASLVVIMNEIDEYLGWVATYVTISAGFIFFLFFKAHLAEGISEQEELLAEAIVGMTGCEDCDTRLEMKSLCDLIFHDPIKITLGYVFVLNKRLMLAFCSQLAASLVILLQFVNH